MIVIDIETRSGVDISKTGVYKYTENMHFDVLLFGYSVDGSSVQVVDLANVEQIPENILRALNNPKIIKSAFNCQFERICLSKYLGLSKYLNPEGWHCDMIHARTLGLPSSLSDVGKVLNIDRQKMAEGKRLIKNFCTPKKRRQF